jgi:hypothetical protein
MQVYLAMNIIYWCMTFLDNLFMIMSVLKDRLSYLTVACLIQIVKNVTGLLDLEGVIDLSNPSIYVLYAVFQVGYGQFFFTAIKTFKHQAMVEVATCLYFTICFIRGFGFLKFDS